MKCDTGRTSIGLVGRGESVSPHNACVSRGRVCVGSIPGSSTGVSTARGLVRHCFRQMALNPPLRICKLILRNHSTVGRRGWPGKAWVRTLWPCGQIHVRVQSPYSPCRWRDSESSLTVFQSVVLYMVRAVSHYSIMEMTNNYKKWQMTMAYWIAKKKKKKHRNVKMKGEDSPEPLQYVLAKW